MALYRSPLTATLWPSSFLKKYGPMIPPAHKAHQTDPDQESVLDLNYVLERTMKDISMLQDNILHSFLYFVDNKHKQFTPQHFTSTLGRYTESGFTREKPVKPPIISQIVLMAPLKLEAMMRL
ncbi:hypothetical protein TNCV_4048071 [Trichonephila clavipes]|nr:hypothetical protein TNCV_4048071 [Trichonephila clavipes]